MSMMLCSGCDGLTDTDDDVEGIFEFAAPFRFWCGPCVEQIVADGDVDHPAMTSLKLEDPKRHAEVVEAMAV